MRRFRVTFERWHSGYAEIDAADFGEAREKALKLEGFEIEWDYPIAEASVEVVDVDELFPDDDED